MVCLPLIRSTLSLQRLTAVSLITQSVSLSTACTCRFNHLLSNSLRQHPLKMSSTNESPTTTTTTTATSPTTATTATRDASTSSQPPPPELREPTFFDGPSGERITKDEFLGRIADTSARVVMVGENHEDTAAHSLELEILQKLAPKLADMTSLSKSAEQKSSTTSAAAAAGLSLEFYDRESQTVMDEYLRGLVDLDTFLENSRPPANYLAYQPLIDYCKDNNLPAIGANCPRRYTRMVSRNGREFVNQLADTSAASLLPPLPYAGASPAYTQNFIDIMKAIGNTNPNVPTRMLDAQSLWDATMAHSISNMLDRVDKVVHVTGYFHIQHRLGTVEHLARYAPNASVLTVVILPSENLDLLNEEQVNIGDLVALTDIEGL